MESFDKTSSVKMSLRHWRCVAVPCYVVFVSLDGVSFDGEYRTNDYYDACFWAYAHVEDYKDLYVSQVNNVISRRDIISCCGESDK